MTPRNISSWSVLVTSTWAVDIPYEKPVYDFCAASFAIWRNLDDIIPSALVGSV